MHTPKEIRENFLRTIEMRYPKWIPCRVVISAATWNKYREKLEDILVKYPEIFPNFKKGSVKFGEFGLRRKGNVYIDRWGCVWKFAIDGIQGQVVKHPLDDWRKLRNLRIPDPEEGLIYPPTTSGTPVLSWHLIEENVRRAHEEGRLAVISFPHGFFFQRLYYLRGFINLMMDFVRRPPELYELIELLTEYNLELIKRALKLKVDIITFGDDLGCQDRMPISPKTFEEFILPSYKRMFSLIRRAGVHVYFHTDGHVMEVVDYLISTGISVLNIQDRVNGINNIKAKCKGKVCIDLDIDRQHLLPFGSRNQIREHIRKVIIELGSKKGGLMLTADIYPDVPLNNIDSVCQAMKEFMKLHLKLPY